MWVLEGPKCVGHDFFSQPFCEVSMFLTIRNCSIYTGSVKIETLDLPTTQSTSGSPSDAHSGWTALGTSNSLGDPVTPNLRTMTNAPKVLSRAPCCPFLWCNLRSTTLHSLAAGTSATIPLCVTFLAPGIYDLSRYRVSWTLLELQESPTVEDVPIISELLLKTTSATYASGHTTVTDVNLQSGSDKTSDSVSTSASGVGFGHPLLLAVVQSNT